MAILKLEAEQSSKFEPKRIICKDVNGDKIAIVFADAAVSFYGRYIQSAELEAIKAVKDNFFLFWDNLIN